jgi:hypothetical protein
LCDVTVAVKSKRWSSIAALCCDCRLGLKVALNAALQA